MCAESRRHGPPVVTIVTATHNRCELLRETVESVIAQDFEAWQMVVVDDASEDDTWEWVTSVRDEGAGVGSGRA